MFIEYLKVVNFRNYTRADVTFAKKTNLIYGLNAQGKTNLLEAIYLLCLGRSFRLAKNIELIKKGTSYFTIEGSLSLDSGLNKKVVIHYLKDGKKEIGIDGKRLKSHADIFGKFPIVVMSPEDYKITSGSPSERRRFIDIILSQVNILYLTNLQEYVKILKQRNKILQNMRDGIPVHESSIEPWTESLVKTGSKILEERQKFISEFSMVLKPIYRDYTNSKDELEVSMESSVPIRKDKSYEESFYSALEEAKKKERRLGVTLVGPHRDDIFFKINGLDIKKYGSRGEHKSVLISIKIAEFNFILQKKEETPIFLLDDYHSELDDLREQKVFYSLQNLGQIFLTCPKESVFNLTPYPLNHRDEVSRFYIEDGKIEQGK
jgi:DNA replication and repair protein RecF